MFRSMRVIIILICITLISTTGALAQDPSTEVGVAVPGQNAIEIIGQIDQSLFNLTTYGYVTHIEGIPDEELFAEGTDPLMRDESNARFTIWGEGQSSGRAIHNNIFASSVNASLEFYYNETPLGASFDTPESFAGGTQIAALSARLYSVLNVQEPNVGVLMVTSDSTQDVAEPFTIGEQSYTLGHVGLLHRFTLFGQGFRSSTEPLAAQYFFGGYAVVVGDSEMAE